MCKWLSVRATLEDGITPHPEIPEVKEFEQSNDWPTCTCWIGDKEADGKALRQLFVENVLREFLDKVGWGNIIIEVR